MAYVTRNWARDEHAFAWSDFKDAVKANWKQSLIISAITSVVPVIVYTSWNFYGELANTQGVVFMVPQMLVVTIAIVWMLSLVFMYPIIVQYEIKTVGLIKNGLMLAIARLPQTVGIRLVTLVPAAIAIVALLHDLCKIGCYKAGTRNVKNEQGRWEAQPYYTIEDNLPYGHGEKSVYIASGYMRLTRDEAFAIRYHMGFSGPEDPGNVGKALEMFPLAWALCVADMEAAYFMEGSPKK